MTYLTTAVLLNEALVELVAARNHHLFPQATCQKRCRDIASNGGLLVYSGAMERSDLRPISGQSGVNSGPIQGQFRSYWGTYVAAAGRCCRDEVNQALDILAVVDVWVR